MDPASNGRFHTFNVPDEWLEEPVRVQSAPQNDEFELPQFFDAVTGQPWNHPPTTAPAPVRRKCGTRARASRGRPVRRRGSRRGPAATRAGPDDGSGDPEPGSSSGHLDRYAPAGRLA